MAVAESGAARSARWRRLRPAAARACLIRFPRSFMLSPLYMMTRICCNVKRRVETVRGRDCRWRGGTRKPVPGSILDRDHPAPDVGGGDPAVGLPHVVADQEAV